MNVDLTIDESAFLNSIMAEFQRVKVPCQAAMALTVYNTIMDNFDGGQLQDRPSEWQPLRPFYAIVRHGGDRTPRLQLSGDLKKSVHGDDSNMEAASIFCDSSYGNFHQEGGETEFHGKFYDIPARPFFPIIDGEVTPLTTQRSLDACKETLETMLK